MARRSRSTEKGPLWHGYRRPVWRDGVFWLAFAASIAGLLMQNAFGNIDGSGGGWAIFAIEVVVTFAVAFALVGVLAGTFRGFGEGWRQAEKTAPPPGPAARPTPAPVEPTPTAPAPAPADPTPTPPVAEPTRSAPDPAERPRAGVEMERHARRLGRAIGAGRRTYKKYDDR